MKDFNIAKYLKEHNLGSHGILGKYVDLHGLKEDKDLGQQDAMPEPYEGPEDPIDGLGGELDRDMDVSMNEEESVLNKMSREYQAWLDKNNLPQMSADELLYHSTIKLTDDQKRYLQDFIDRWNEEEDIYVDTARNENVSANEEVSVSSSGVEMEEDADDTRIMDLGGSQIEQGIISLLDDGFEYKDIVELFKMLIKDHIKARSMGKSF